VLAVLQLVLTTLLLAIALMSHLQREFTMLQLESLLLKLLAQALTTWELEMMHFV
jgi:hypothetical protein